MWPVHNLGKVLTVAGQMHRYNSRSDIYSGTECMHEASECSMVKYMMVEMPAWHSLLVSDT